MKLYAIAVLCVFLASEAHAARIKDMSMPVGESLAQPDIDHGNPFGGNAPGTFMPYSNGDKAPQIPQDNSTTSNRFMDNYCNPNKTSIIANSPRMHEIQSCIDSGKQKTCAEYARLPADAKIVLEAQVICAVEAAERTGEDDTPKKDCKRYDSERIDLLKKYEQDAQTTATLLHLTDDVVYGSSRCITGMSQ